MTSANDSFLSLEKHRLQLEENAKQLAKTLQHWQTWDAEYEALKEEVEAIPEPCTPDQLHKVHAEFEGELLTGKEIDEVFGLRGSKSRDQIINVLQRRIDYVGKNVASLEKQLETAENMEKYSAATVISQPDAADEDGQPITEIVEELDDDDNVVSYRLDQPGRSLPQIQETLEKAGLGDVSSEKSAATKTEVSESAPSEKGGSAVSISSKSIPNPTSTSPAPTTTIPAPSVKKSVSFSEEVQAAEPPSAEMSVRAKRVDRIMKTAKEQESISKEDPVIPEDEDEADATLRRQMLEYSMGQVGAVVAEIDLEEDDLDDDSGFDYGEDNVDDDFDNDDDDDDDDDDEEDKFGRFTGRVVTDKYRRRMLELEQKLGIKSRFTEQAERDEAEKSGDGQGGIGRIVVKQGTGPTSSSSRPIPQKSNFKDYRNNGDAGEKKGVRFAQALEIAPEAEAETVPIKDQTAPVVDPLSDIVERTVSTKATEVKPARKPSRFKKARDVNPAPVNEVVPKGPFDIPTHYVQQEQRTVPTGPKGSTIADKLLERDTPSCVIAPDEFDETMVHQEVADEHQRMRRRFIQRDGGFLKEDESVIQPLDEADGGEPVSHFKAARLSRH